MYSNSETAAGASKRDIGRRFARLRWKRKDEFLANCRVSRQSPTVRRCTLLPEHLTHTAHRVSQSDGGCAVARRGHDPRCGSADRRASLSCFRPVPPSAAPAAVDTVPGMPPVMDREISIARPGRAAQSERDRRSVAYLRSEPPIEQCFVIDPESLRSSIAFRLAPARNMSFPLGSCRRFGWRTTVSTARQGT